MKRKGRQTDIGSALSGLVARLDRKGGGRFAQIELAEAWRDVAGGPVAAHTTGFFVRDGEAVIYVDSPVWATELSALAGHYLEAIRKRTGQTSVRSMRFVVSKKVSEEHKFIALEKREERALERDKVESVPLTPEEVEEVERSVAAIADAELREAALRATIADLEWKKGISARNSRQKPSQGL